MLLEDSSNVAREVRAHHCVDLQEVIVELLSRHAHHSFNDFFLLASDPLESFSAKG